VDDLKQVVAITALNKMMASGHFDICAIRTIAEMLGVDPKGDAYRTLAPLHCVNFSDMPQELRQMIPALIKQCLGVEPIHRFALPAATQTDPVVVEIPAKRGLMRLLSR
jgi:hypothetical protein